MTGFSAKQIRALKRDLDSRHIRTREANSQVRSYVEGWYALSEANRIFGFDGWNRETLDSRCVLTRESPLIIHVSTRQPTPTAKSSRTSSNSYYHNTTTSPPP